MKHLLTLAAAATMLVACKKEDLRNVRYQVECARCLIEYADADGKRYSVAVNGTWEKRLPMESGTAVYMSGCSYNNPTGGSVNNLQPWNSHVMRVFLDNEAWSTYSASSSFAKLDSVQVNATQWRKYYTDTCAVLSGAVPER